jgi:Cof subfamily protein (haloacid dehalogenase superfamily)
VSHRLRLLAIDIDGTLLNPDFQISAPDLRAIRRAHAEGVETILATGRRHTFALPIAEQLGFDLSLISSNGAITRSLSGETFHRDLLPLETCRKVCATMREFRGNTVLTFDIEQKGAIVLERMEELTVSIRRWLEKNIAYINFVIPIEDALTGDDPVQAMFCGSMERMCQALEVLEAAEVHEEITILRTEYPHRNLSMLDVINQGCSKGHALARWAKHRNILPSEIMAIGDNYNDVEMLAFAGMPFIMGNACEELRGKGWPVTSANDQNGVAAAIESVLGVREPELDETNEAVQADAI